MTEQQAHAYARRFARKHNQPMFVVYDPTFHDTPERSFYPADQEGLDTMFANVMPDNIIACYDPNDWDGIQ